MKTLKIGFATKRLDVQQAAHGCQVASSWCPRWASETAGGLETVPKFQRTDLLPQDLQSRSEKLVANQMAKASFAGRTSPAKNDLSYLVQSSPEISKSKDSVKHWNYTALTFFVMPHVRMICPLHIVL